MTSTVERRLSAALTETAHLNVPDTESIPAFQPPLGSDSSAGLRPWLRPAVAAAVVVAVAVGGVLAVRHSGSNSNRPASTAGIVLRIKANPDSGSATPEQLRMTGQLVLKRATVLGIRKPSVTQPRPGELEFSLPGATSGQLAALTSVDALQFRPLLMEMVPAKPSVPGSLGRTATSPWHNLDFVPSAASVSALTPTELGALRTAVADWDCRRIPIVPADQPTVACSTDGVGKFLLGPAVVDSADIINAVPAASSDGAARSAVDVTLSPTGQQRWADYTRLHNEKVQVAAQANVVADVLDGVVLVASTILEEITGITQILDTSPNQTPAQLAGMLSTGALPVPVSVLSVRPR